MSILGRGDRTCPHSAGPELQLMTTSCRVKILLQNALMAFLTYDVADSNLFSPIKFKNQT